MKKRERAARHPNSLKVENERLREALGLGGTITEGRSVGSVRAAEGSRPNGRRGARTFAAQLLGALRRLGFDVTLDENGR